MTNKRTDILQTAILEFLGIATSLLHPPLVVLLDPPECPGLSRDPAARPALLDPPLDPVLVLAPPCPVTLAKRTRMHRGGAVDAKTEE